jgi:hypothetical protein
MSDNQIKQMQIALAQTMKDVGAVGPQADQKLVEASKLGTLQSLKDAGMLKNQQQQGGLTQKDLDDDYTKIYKDAAPDIRRQIELRLGLQPSQQEPISPTQADTATKVHNIANAQDQNQLADRKQNLAEQQHQTQTQLSEKDLALKATTAQTQAQLQREANSVKTNNTTAK